ncbi:MAG TPA: hypothetical protein DEO56_05600 [Nitrosomonas nitrosa]|uniref:Uncharacterized protein n=1 Tax=Nitrosomonas nitrosa TaxID=52442 RepID=A0A8H8Z1C5_9PROT|nr:hypothetical protein [Nitrosomonas nitrosa]MCO6434870.1 hypothetical protein [Nitrosomonas nitrosa]CAE6514771.1 hypothetical protein NMYAN_50152 [Nitrosomonas nitrosa]HBZ30057.1 hypothetical protein [Nitrosomonas nitrosa]HNP50993.1 hypothetical protein [Nitrosomonas nitrosa]
MTDAAHKPGHDGHVRAYCYTTDQPVAKKIYPTLLALLFYLGSNSLRIKDNLAIMAATAMIAIPNPLCSRRLNNPIITACCDRKIKLLKLTWQNII